jgi:RNA polymerase sigma-70 factor, ECF subfamily
MSRQDQPETPWREHRERLYRFVLHRVHDAAEAEDIVHDVLLRAYNRRATLRDVGSFEPWLYQVTRNAIIDHYRARRPTEPLPDNLPEADSDDAHTARAELSRCIQPFVAALPVRYRDAVQLSEIHGLTQQATADALGLTLSGAKSRVQRARRMLADMMLECCRVEFDSAGAIMSYEGPHSSSRDSEDSRGSEGGGPAGCVEC